MKKKKVDTPAGHSHTVEGARKALGDAFNAIFFKLTGRELNRAKYFVPLVEAFDDLIKAHMVSNDTDPGEG